MSIFSKKKKVSGIPDRERTLYEVARNIYPVIIKMCDKYSHTKQAYDKMPETAARQTMVFAKALTDELMKGGEE